MRGDVCARIAAAAAAAAADGNVGGESSPRQSSAKLSRRLSHGLRMQAGRTLSRLKMKPVQCYDSSTTSSHDIIIEMSRLIIMQKRTAVCLVGR